MAAPKIDIEQNNALYNFFQLLPINNGIVKLDDIIRLFNRPLQSIYKIILAKDRHNKNAIFMFDEIRLLREAQLDLQSIDLFTDEINLNQKNGPQILKEVIKSIIKGLAPKYGKLYEEMKLSFVIYWASNPDIIREVNIAEQRHAREKAGAEASVKSERIQKEIQKRLEKIAGVGNKPNYQQIEAEHKKFKEEAESLGLSRYEYAAMIKAKRDRNKAKAAELGISLDEYLLHKQARKLAEQQDELQRQEALIRERERAAREREEVRSARVAREAADAAAREAADAHANRRAAEDAARRAAEDARRARNADDAARRAADDAARRAEEARRAAAEDARRAAAEDARRAAAEDARRAADEDARRRARPAPADAGLAVGGYAYTSRLDDALRSGRRALNLIKRLNIVSEIDETFSFPEQEFIAGFKLNEINAQLEDRDYMLRFQDLYRQIENEQSRIRRNTDEKHRRESNQAEQKEQEFNADYVIPRHIRELLNKYKIEIPENPTKQKVKSALRKIMVKERNDMDLVSRISDIANTLGIRLKVGAKRGSKRGSKGSAKRGSKGSTKRGSKKRGSKSGAKNGAKRGSKGSAKRGSKM